MCTSIVKCMGWGDLEDAPLLYPLITMVYITLEDAPLLFALITMIYIANRCSFVFMH